MNNSNIVHQKRPLSQV